MQYKSDSRTEDKSPMKNFYLESSLLTSPVQVIRQNSAKIFFHKTFRKMQKKSSKINNLV